MRTKQILEKIAVMFGIISIIALFGALISAGVGSSIAAVTCVILTSVAGLLAGVLESIRLTK